MGCGSSLDAMYDDPMPVVVFGATGIMGGAVARALLRDRRFEVKAVTRTPTTDDARALAEAGAIIVTADLNDSRSLTRVLDGAHAVFLITHYWEHVNKNKEIRQGKHCVDAAVNAGVAHFVFYGSENPVDVTGSRCAFMESKAAIELYINEINRSSRRSDVPIIVQYDSCYCLPALPYNVTAATDLPFTVLRVPFYFENFLGVFRPHKVNSGEYAIALPMEDHTLEMVGARDVGMCVLKVLLNPRHFLCRVVALGTERLTVQQITDTFNKHFTDRKFICPVIRVKDYESFNFEGAQDIAAMFEFYQHGGLEPCDPKLKRKTQGSLVSFDHWVADHKQKLADHMDASWFDM